MNIASVIVGLSTYYTYVTQNNTAITMIEDLLIPPPNRGNNQFFYQTSEVTSYMYDGLYEFGKTSNYSSVEWATNMYDIFNMWGMGNNFTIYDHTSPFLSANTSAFSPVGKVNWGVIAILPNVIDMFTYDLDYIGAYEKCIWDWLESVRSPLYGIRFTDFNQKGYTPNHLFVWASIIKYEYYMSIDNYQLDMDSYPTVVDYYINGSQYTTQRTHQIGAGTYNITFADSITRNGKAWDFQYWVDNSSNTNPVRLYTVSEDAELIAVYEPEIPISQGDLVFASGMDLDYAIMYNTTFSEDELIEGQLFDTSQYARHGTLYPTTSLYSSVTRVNGKFGYGLEFDGIDDRIIMPFSNISTGFTFSCWIYPYNTTGTKRIVWSSNRYSIYVQDGILKTVLTTESLNQYADYNVTNIAINEWVYIAVTYDQNNGYYLIWIGGQLVNTVETDGLPINDFQVSTSISTYPNSWDGVIDEVRIYSYALSQKQIQTDMVTYIKTFKDYWAVKTWTRLGWDDKESPTHAYFNYKDSGLPVALSDATYNKTSISSIHHMFGFQKYRYYCTLETDTNITTWDNHNYNWEFKLYRKGVYQVSYRIRVQLKRELGNYTALRTYLEEYYNGTWKSYAWDIWNLTPELTSGVPIVVDAWIGDDDEHFSLRFSLGNATGSDGEYFSQYSYRLVDYEGNTRTVDWYDGFITFVLSIDNESYSANTLTSTVEISEHGALLTIAVLLLAGVIVGTVGTLAYQYVLRPYIKETFGFALPPFPFLPEESKDFIHQIVVAFSGAITPVVNALRPLGDALLNIGRPIVQAIINFIGDLTRAVVDGIDAILLYVFQVDNIFSDFLSGIAYWIGQIGVFAGWIGTQIPIFITALVDLVTGVATLFGSIFSTISYMITNPSGNIFSLLSGFLTYMGDMWEGTGMFSGGLAMKDWFYLFLIIAPLFIAVSCIKSGSIEPLWSILRTFGMIFNLLKTIIMFGFNMFLKIIRTILDILPF